jgi:hypothetical protein
MGADIGAKSLIPTYASNGGAVRPTVSVDHSKPGRKRIPVSIL